MWRHAAAITLPHRAQNRGAAGDDDRQIGVIMAKPVMAGAYEKSDVGWDTVQRGAHADLYSSLTPWEGEQRAIVSRASLDHDYREFKQRVADGRTSADRRSSTIWPAVACWTGEQALAHGLVDHLGDFDVAVEVGLRGSRPAHGRAACAWCQSAQPGRRCWPRPPRPSRPIGLRGAAPVGGVDRFTRWRRIGCLLASGSSAVCRKVKADSFVLTEITEECFNMLDVHAVRRQFPALQENYNGRPGDIF